MTRRAALWSLLAAGAVLHALVTLPNHWLFRTYALDLGLYTHSAWRYAHGHVPDSALFEVRPSPMLADHFDLYLVLFAPLLFVFGTWTLLLVQWISIIIGALGVRKCLLSLGLEEYMALCGTAIFLCFFGVFSASAFDYHSNVVATMVLPWLLSSLHEGKRMAGALLCAGMLIAKENIGFWLTVVLLAFSFHTSLTAPMRRFCRVLSVVTLCWSVLIIGVVMPAMAGDGQYAHLDYPLLSDLLRPGGWAGLAAPWHLCQALFLDVTGAENGTAIKVEFWVILLVSGGWALIVRPLWGAMALPLIAQKMWHDEPSKWAVFGQYSIEFAPLVAIAVPLALDRWTRAGTLRWPLWLAPILTAACTVRTMDNTVAFYAKSRMRFYQMEHYERTYDTDPVHVAIDSIPPDLAVSAQSPLVPHLALRERLYQFPIVRDADVIVLLPQEDPYPLDAASYQDSLNALLADPRWVVRRPGDAVYLFRRIDRTR